MQYKDFFRFIENKDRLIDKLNLSDEQKERLKAYFKKYPTSESKIDWNRKDLSWKDFEPLLANEGKSKSQAKKKGIEGLKEGEDYEIIWQGTVATVSTAGGDEEIPVTIYYPLSFLGSETLANPKVEPLGITGKWCIAGGSYGPDNDDLYFRDYVKMQWDFFFVFTIGEKYAVARHTDNNGIHTSLVYFDSEDNEFECDTDTVIEGSDGLFHYIGKEFWDTVNEKIKFYPKKLTWNSLVITKQDGTQWSKDGKVLYNAGELKGWDEYIIPKECKKILPMAFEDTEKFLKVIIPSGSDISFKVDGEDDVGVFSGFRGIVEFENGCTEVPDDCFYSANYIQDIILPPTIETIGSCAFAWMEDEDFWTEVQRGRKKLNFKGLNLKSVELRAFMQTPIREFPFQDYPNCVYKEQTFCETALMYITLPEGMTEIPKQMFSHSFAINQQITLPSTLKKIGVNALGMLDQNNATVRFRGLKSQWASIETEGWHHRSLRQPKVIWEPVTQNKQLVAFYCAKSPERFAMDQEGNLYTLDTDPEMQEPVWRLSVIQVNAEYRHESHYMTAGPQ